MSKNVVPILVVAFACVIAAIGFVRKDLDMIGAFGFVSGAVTFAAGLHVRAKRKTKKPAKLPVVEKAPEAPK